MREVERNRGMERDHQSIGVNIRELEEAEANLRS
jgi:hypothetical protein